MAEGQILGPVHPQEGSCSHTDSKVRSGRGHSSHILCPNSVIDTNQSVFVEGEAGALPLESSGTFFGLWSHLELSFLEHILQAWLAGLPGARYYLLINSFPARPLLMFVFPRKQTDRDLCAGGFWVE